MSGILKGLLAGAVGSVTVELFLLAVYAVLGVPLIRLNQSDAAHLIGKSAYSGGISTALLGFVLNELVALTWGVIAYALMQRFSAARARPIVFGTVFGLVVMVVMNWGVLPFTQETVSHITPRFIIVMVLAHTIFFGIPVALTAAYEMARVPSPQT